MLLSSDDEAFGGSGLRLPAARSRKRPMHGLDPSVSVTLPAFSAVYFSVPAEKKAVKKAPAKKAAPKKAAQTTVAK